mmetsp:Transcript_7454/g.23854  ORF Transcript_7454/g.23854 Transcript_7454/m.23854 type:complete len:137 (-) Transcript_7454:410-820(-)
MQATYNGAAMPEGVARGSMGQGARGRVLSGMAARRRGFRIGEAVCYVGDFEGIVEHGSQGVVTRVLSRNDRGKIVYEVNFGAGDDLVVVPRTLEEDDLASIRERERKQSGLKRLFKLFKSPPPQTGAVDLPPENPA